MIKIKIEYIHSVINTKQMYICIMYCYNISTINYLLYTSIYEQKTFSD